jgi:superfamily II DNA or RNA helicase/HKD family nuclease
LSESALLINGRNQPSIGHEVNRELSTADHVDLLCSFILNSGLNVVERRLRQVGERGGRVRVLTTTYMGATQRRAIDRLAELGAEVRISYDGSTSRLHAKSWHFRRATGASTAYVGSSNLSRTALTDGIEWNIRIAAREQPEIIATIASTFENYWNDPDFSPYDPVSDAARLDDALRRGASSPQAQLSISFANLDVVARPFQQEILDQLNFQRISKNQRRNLVAMATGTGKTVVAGLDFAQLLRSGAVRNLLFVAHRREIIEQSLTTFRTILRDGSFGELLIEGSEPTDWSNVFASIQSLHQDRLAELPPRSYDMIIVDEFHHAAADSYTRLLEHFDPKYLLGLTATPERSDGKPILQYFDNTVSAELRLWDAIDRQILSPFQYFGIHDNVDLQAANITFRRGQGYDVSELTNLYTANDSRVALVLENLRRFTDDLSVLKCLGFCVSIEHAEYMANKFNTAGIPSAAVTSRLDSATRTATLNRLRSGELKTIFAVDIFNEGVDIPEVNTILMLRPTESSTVFLQQLGRGLRKTPEKACLVVLDFVGNQNAKFRFDTKYQSLLSVRRRELAAAIEGEFPRLPLGCHFELDRVSRDIVLKNLKSALQINKRVLVDELRSLGPTRVSDFLMHLGLSLKEFYRSGRSLSALNFEVFGKHSDQPVDDRSARAIARFVHVNDSERIENYTRLLRGQGSIVSNPYAMMLAGMFFEADARLDNLEKRIIELRESPIADELCQVLEMCDSERDRLINSRPDPQVPLAAYGTYTRMEAITAFGVEPRLRGREGVQRVDHLNAELAFVTLNKTEKHFSASTMYADTALSSTFFQWESQSSASATSVAGRRYVNQQALGLAFHLFVREWRLDPDTGTTMPFMYFGPATYVSHEGAKPMRIRWKLHYPIPADVLRRSKVIAS